jgi:ABC-type polysaccharide/polyol phosphate export permease
MFRFLKDIMKYREYITFSAKARLKAEVANSYLNWIWWVLEPFCFMIIYTLVFGFIFESGEANFPVYIFIGSIIWTFFSKTIATSVNMIRANEMIIAKIYLPKYVLLIVEMVVNFFKMLVSVALVTVMMFIFHISISIQILWLVPVLFIFFLVTFAIGTLLMHYGVYLDDLSHAITIFLNMMMYFTGIFFSIEDRLDQPLSTILGIFNPIAFLLTSTRQAVMYSTMPDLMILGIWSVIAVLLAYLGIKTIYNNENNYVKII